MNQRNRSFLFSSSAVLIASLWMLLLPRLLAAQPEIPPQLKPWQDWATWNDKDRESPSAFNSTKDRIPFWPSRLSLEAGGSTGKWQVEVEVFGKTWVPLPGSEKAWPQNVKNGEESAVVVARDGRPCVQLEPGRHELSGEFTWENMPQRIAIPKEIGLLDLKVDDKAVVMPNWDANGNVWLRRTKRQATEKNQISAQVYRVLEDGIPLWLRTEIELTVAGSSREEELGWMLPEGWQLATIDSLIPVAVDDDGKLKAQVRSGKWKINATAFCTNDKREFRFGENSQPIIDRELIGFQTKSSFRLAELTGLTAGDVSQTTFPERWRSLPVYQWDTSTAFGLDEKVRGMGLQRPAGLTVNRQVWLDEDGVGATWRDFVGGQMQQLWRLDTADGQSLGSVRVAGKGQLITANPATGSHGVEIRTRNLKLDAVGEIESVAAIPATGWQADVDSLSMTMNLPPGWRALAVFGADSVQGDWLTAWTLLDLFLLLIFSIAVCRIWGIPAGLIAFVAFGLSYHEPGAPRLAWLFLLMPLALLKVVPDGAAKKWLDRWKLLALAVLVLCLAPFLKNQVQSALYPQLERPGVNYQARPLFNPNRHSFQRAAQVADSLESWNYSSSSSELSSAKVVPQRRQSKFQMSNLLQDATALIQTGPAAPEWTWNQVQCQWSGPVSATQQVRPILISRNQHRLLSIVRIVLLALLAMVLLGAERLSFLFNRRTVAAVAFLGVLCFSPDQQTFAQEIPDKETLEALRSRLLEVPDAFPRAAEIPSVELNVENDTVTMQAEVHAALRVAVPLPGKLPTWSPVSVSVDGEDATLLRRKDDYLWVVLPAGVHEVTVESRLPAATEWEWTFLLKPRKVTVQTEDWNVSGINRDGVPEQQVFFSRKQQAVEGDAAYDRKDFNAIVAVDRQIETGLIWQVQTDVTRLVSPGKAVSVRIPLLPGEKVLTAGAIVEDGMIEVRLGTGQKGYQWKSEITLDDGDKPTAENAENGDLPPTRTMELVAAETDDWVERWHLLTSPVWHMNHEGLTPIFEDAETALVPVWHPWPGEKVTLAFNKPQAIPGATMTVQRVNCETQLGSRLRTHKLNASLESSLGGDFQLTLDADAEITSVKVSGQSIPVRVEQGQLVIPIRPGKQAVEVEWRTEKPLTAVVHNELITMPVASANITTSIRVPESRWVLWANGPTRGPAVQFWVILIVAWLAAMILGSFSFSPLSRLEWMLLVTGLTQVHIAAALFVVAWLFALGMRGQTNMADLGAWRFNFRQLGLLFITLISLVILVVVVGEGLLGHPRMFVLGNGSSRTFLQWFSPRVLADLPSLTVVSVSVWFYRLLMLVWALWLAFALLRWMADGWKSFCRGGAWRPWFKQKAEVVQANPVVE